METMPTTSPPPVPAKPRKSRRLWYVLAGVVLMLIVTPVVIYWAFDYWGERQMAELTAELDAEDPNWRWPDLIAEIKPPPDEQNSAVQIGKVRALLQKKAFTPGPKWDNGGPDPLIHRNSRLTDEMAALLRVAFTNLPQETLAEARKLKDLPAGCFAVPAAEIPFTISLDYVQKAREIMYLLQLDAAWRAHEGDCDGAAESCMAILNTAEALKEQPFIISQLVRIAGQAIAVGSIERTLGQGTVSEANLRKLQELLEASAAEDGLHQSMRGERAAGHQMYIKIREGNLSLSGLYGTVMNSKPGPGERLLDAFPGVILGGYPEYLRLMSKQVRVSKLKDAERAEAYAKIEQEVRENRSNVLIRLIMPATQKVAEAVQRSQAYQRSAIVGLAAERHRLKTKQWPGSIEELVKAGLLKEVPRDPFDGKALRFKRTPTGIVIYSVGFDKVDNGGKFDRTNPRLEGTDIGFQLWDRRGLPPVVEPEGP
jgi:hypothetical protein